MQETQLNQITNFIVENADDMLRDLYARGKYRGLIMPITVSRCFDAVLDGTVGDGRS